MKIFPLIFNTITCAGGQETGPEATGDTLLHDEEPYRIPATVGVE
jgi:hypothetical protein